MNKIINKFLFTGDKFIPKLHLKQLGFTYTAGGPFTKHCKRIRKFIETGSLKHLYRNELDKACFAHDTTYSDRKDLAKRTISDKILKDRAYEIVRNWKYDGYQKATMVYKFFDKKTGSEISVNEQLAKEFHKPVIKKFKRRKVYARFKDNIWAADLTEMESLSSKSKNLLCVIDIFTKYARVKPLKDKKGKTVFNAFIEIVNGFNRKRNKIWVNQGREFYNKLCKNG